MYIVKTTGRRGKQDVMWNVGGMTRVLELEDAVDLAFDALADAIAQAPQRTLWTEFGERS